MPFISWGELVAGEYARTRWNLKLRAVVLALRRRRSIGHLGSKGYRLAPELVTVPLAPRTRKIRGIVDVLHHAVVLRREGPKACGDSRAYQSCASALDDVTVEPLSHRVCLRLPGQTIVRHDPQLLQSLVDLA